MRARYQDTRRKLASLRGWLWGLMHDPRWWKTTGVFTLMWGIGWGLVYLWTSHLGHPWSGRQLVSIVMLWPTYRIHRWLWRDRQVNPRWRWSKTWIKLHGLNMAVYWLAVNAAGLQYMTAGMAMTVPFALLAYYWRDETDFVAEVPTAEIA